MESAEWMIVWMSLIELVQTLLIAVFVSETSIL